MTTAPLSRVFISYSHDSENHRKRALALADKLRHDGLDSSIDQYVLNPKEGWPRWMKRQVTEADFVLVVCSETYRRRFEGDEEPGKGKGADWEGILVTQQLYEDRSSNEKFVPVLMEGAVDEDIPLALQPYTHYRMPGGYDDLYRYLTTQPKTVPPPVGTKRVLPPNPR